MDLEKLVSTIAETAKESEHLLNAVLKYKGKYYGWEGLGRAIVVQALQKMGVEVKIRNKGPDLEFKNKKLEFKFIVEPSLSWLKNGLKYDRVDCLFIGPSSFEFIRERIHLSHYSFINKEWMVGIVANTNAP